MSVDIVTKEDLERFRLALLEDIKNILAKPEKTEGKKWLRSNEVRKLLSISTGTLQNLCINDVLHPTKVVGINYYSTEEIEKVLQSEEFKKKTL